MLLVLYVLHSDSIGQDELVADVPDALNTWEHYLDRLVWIFFRDAVGCGGEFLSFLIRDLRQEDCG